MRRIVIAGVSGCGKSTIGRLVAASLGAEFLDADDYHPATNLEKMSAGVPLKDDDRWPWLDRLSRELAEHDKVVLACSALKRVYRDRLRSLVPEVEFVVLTLPRAVLKERIRSRDHFMPASLLDSQLHDLELGPDVIVFENLDQPKLVAARILNGA